MRWVLGANTVKLWGFSGPSPFEHVRMADEEGLDVWLEFNPTMAWERNNPDISVSSYCENLARFAQAAEEAKVKVLVVGHEIDIHLTSFKPETGDLRRGVDELVKTARQNYSGLVTYCNWPDVWDITNINWEPMDYLHPQLYKSDCKRELTDEEYLDALLKWENTVPGKPLVISEWGSVTVKDPLAIGACCNNLENLPYQYDPVAQAEAIERSIKVLLHADIYGFFLHDWDGPDFPDSAYKYAKNWSQIGYGIWNSKTNEPKPSFWIVYKYYKER